MSVSKIGASLPRRLEHRPSMRRNMRKGNQPQITNNQPTTNTTNTTNTPTPFPQPKKKNQPAKGAKRNSRKRKPPWAPLLLPSAHPPPSGCYLVSLFPSPPPCILVGPSWPSSWLCLLGPLLGPYVLVDASF